MINNKRKGIFSIFIDTFLKLLQLIERLLHKLRGKIEESIRFELMIVIGICFIVSSMFYSFTNNFFKREYTEPQISYDYESIERNASDLVDDIESMNFTLDDEEKIEDILNNNSNADKAYITDLDGNILYKTQNVAETSVDIYTALKNAMTNVNYEKLGVVKEKNYIMPLKIEEKRVYLIYSKVPDATITYTTIKKSNSSLALFLSVLIFIIIFVVVTNRKMKYLDEIGLGLKIIASGNLDYKIEEKGTDEIKNIASNINNMAKEIGEKINSERIAEKTKSDLITNVSHDLRTPLTSIMGYLGLVMEERYQDEKERKEYLSIAYSKSERLKLLIEDLFEYTKLNNNGIELQKTKVNLSEFLYQLIEEFIPMIEENNLTINKKFECETFMAEIDTMKMLRVFENLLTNAIKYSDKPGEITIAMYPKGDNVIILFRNKGTHLSKEKTDKLFDRFYRVDESRNTDSGGSGLGLAISKNIVELHGGKIWADSVGDNINFYIELKQEV